MRGSVDLSAGLFLAERLNTEPRADERPIWKMTSRLRAAGCAGSGGVYHNCFNKAGLLGQNERIQVLRLDRSMSSKAVGQSIKDAQRSVF